MLAYLKRTIFGESTLSVSTTAGASAGFSHLNHPYEWIVQWQPNVDLMKLFSDLKQRVEQFEAATNTLDSEPNQRGQRIGVEDGVFNIRDDVVWLAYCFKTGRHCTKNSKEALRLYRVAAESLEHPQGMFGLAMMLIDSKQMLPGMRWLERAKKAGHPSAYMMMCTMRSRREHYGNWSESLHLFYPREDRERVVLLLLVRRRPHSALHSIPKDVFYCIIQMVLTK